MQQIVEIDPQKNLIIKTKNWCIEKINNTDKSLARLTNKQRSKIKLVKSGIKVRTSLAILKK